MMSDIETLLKNLLPEQNGKNKSHSEIKEIDRFIDGKYLGEDKLIFLTEDSCKLPFNYGRIELNQFQINELIAIWLNRAITSYIELDQILFIDTETTGLWGGSGTFAFMIGLGYFAEKKIKTEQYFLTDPHGEDRLISILEEKFSSFDILASFNGKSFDIPLLRNRFIMHHKKMPEKVDLDLLHISRRIWKNKLQHFTLHDLEKQVLGKSRNVEDDIPGSIIPSVYFEYLDMRNAEQISRVFYHNKLDIISMTALLLHLSSNLDKAFSNREDNDLTVLENTAKFCEDIYEIEKAIMLYRKILDIEPEHIEALLKLSFIYKRMQEFSEAENLWQKAAELGNISAHIELAKVEEHKNHNFRKALLLTKKAIEIFKSSSIFDVEIIEALLHRHRRLMKKNPS